MRIVELSAIRRVLVYREIVDLMRNALIAQFRGECETPMPMHLDIAGSQAEVHMKASYRRGGRYFALKVASTFPGNIGRGLPTGNGMMLLASAETGEPAALLARLPGCLKTRTPAKTFPAWSKSFSESGLLNIPCLDIQMFTCVTVHISGVTDSASRCELRAP